MKIEDWKQNHCYDELGYNGDLKVRFGSYDPSGNNVFSIAEFVENYATDIYSYKTDIYFSYNNNDTRNHGTIIMDKNHGIFVSINYDHKASIDDNFNGIVEDDKGNLQLVKFYHYPFFSHEEYESYNDTDTGHYVSHYDTGKITLDIYEYGDTSHCGI